MWKWYNQNKEYYTRSGCSIYTLFNILQIQYWIKVKNSFIIKVLRSAEKDKVWYESWWAYFWKIYNWFVVEIFKMYEVEVKVISLDIRSKKFEKLYNDWYAFWLWLKYAWLWYRKARRDWIITSKEISTFTSWRIAWHNHTYIKAVTGEWIIIDSLWTVSWKIVRMSLKNLRKAVDKWLYYPTCRILVMKNKRLKYYLKFFQRGGKIDSMEGLSRKNFKLAEKALKLRMVKR